MGERGVTLRRLRPPAPRATRSPQMESGGPVTVGATLDVRARRRERARRCRSTASSPTARSSRRRRALPGGGAIFLTGINATDGAVRLVARGVGGAATGGTPPEAVARRHHASRSSSWSGTASTSCSPAAGWRRCTATGRRGCWRHRRGGPRARPARGQDGRRYDRVTVAAASVAAQSVSPVLPSNSERQAVRQHLRQPRLHDALLRARRPGSSRGASAPRRLALS